MYTHYRGTTFQFIGVLQNNGVPQDLSAGTLVAKVFDKTGTILYGTLTITPLDPVNGLITLSYPDTSAWPVGNARMDCTLSLPNNTFLASGPEFFRIAQNPVVA